MSRLALLTVVLLTALPAAAHGALVFDREPLDPAVWIANDDGTNARRLAAGSQPSIAPDGRTVAFLRVARTEAAGGLELMTVPADASAPPRVLAKHWGGGGTFAWSPDSRRIATDTGRDGSIRSLALIDV